MPSQNNIWSKEEEDFLRDNWGFETRHYIAHHLGKTLWAIKIKAKELQLPKVKSLKVWGRTAENFLKENYRHLSNKEMAKKLNEMLPFSKKSFTPMKVNDRLVALGIKRTDDELKYVKARNVKNGCMKGVGGSNEKEIGHISLRPNYYNNNGVRTPAYKIKVSETKWQLFKHYVWEQHWGPIPKGYQVSTLSKNELNFTIEDLVLTRRMASAEKAHEELSNNAVMGYILSHKEKTEAEEIREMYKKNPGAFQSLIERHRKAIILNRKLYGKGKNK